MLTTKTRSAELLDMVHVFVDVLQGATTLSTRDSWAHPVLIDNLQDNNLSAFFSYFDQQFRLDSYSFAEALQ
jgi:hypothetical protein